MKITLEIKTLPKTPNAIGKASIWTSHNERHKWRKLLCNPVGKMDYTDKVAVEGVYPTTRNSPLKKAKLTLTRCSSREPDLDNLYSSFKFVIDGLKFNRFIEDDKPSNIDLKCLWHKVKPKEGKIIIQIEEIK